MLANIDEIIEAASLIQAGEVVAFPTETVYGLGADATNEAACAKIYALKGRPSNNPLIVHVVDMAAAKQIAEFNDYAILIAQAFWPGPVSLVLPLKNNHQIVSSVTACLPTIAIRVPNNVIAQQFLKQAAKPIAAPSANLSNYISSTTSDHVRESFTQIKIIDGGNSVIGIESTIIDCTKIQPTILRQGFITTQDITAVTNSQVMVNLDYKVLLAPGMMKKHYSPKALVRLNASKLKIGELGLGFGKINFAMGANLSIEGNLVEAASNLYKMLRELDKLAEQANYHTIAVAPIPYHNIGIAINERLNKAAA